MPSLRRPEPPTDWLHLLLSVPVIGWFCFRSFKRFFMLDQGDFVVQFMDMTDGELKMPVNKISEQRLESLLELSIR